jgi:hypothetical protein
MVMVGVSIIANVIFLIDSNFGNQKNVLTRKDIVIFLVLVLITIFLGLFTYDGVLSLLSVFATLLYIVSIWQKNVIVYKIIGILICLSWMLYNIYIMSVVGIILEIVLFVCAIVGLYKTTFQAVHKK